ncbi:LysR family transcriptional regulator [Thalassospira aquimaris]|nr:LysR substrate-binding domain-containing protein [Thalassospira sp. FZY0004]
MHTNAMLCRDQYFMGINMEIRQMRYFVALAETLHFGKAAARMNMTQPPFSRQIAAIEREMKVELVVRNSRHVALTLAGQRFLDDARRVLALLDAACRDARLVSQGQIGELRLGFMMHAAHRLVPDIIRRYAQIRPNVKIVLAETTPGNIRQQLAQGELDAAITFAEPMAPEFDSISILTDQLCLIAPSGHPLALRDKIRASDLEDVDLIVAPEHIASPLYAAIMQYCQTAGFVPAIKFAPHLQHTIVRLVAAGLGVGLVPASICDDTMSEVVVRPLEFPPSFEVVLTFAQNSINPAVAALVEMFEDGGTTVADRSGA